MTDFWLSKKLASLGPLLTEIENRMKTQFAPTTAVYLMQTKKGIHKQEFFQKSWPQGCRNFQNHKKSMSQESYLSKAIHNL